VAASLPAVPCLTSPGAKGPRAASGAASGAAATVRLAEVAERIRPFVPTSERAIAVAGDLGALLPGGGLRRGSVVALDGRLGSGLTTVALTLAAAVTGAGEWAVAVDDGTLGGRAAAEAGVELERFAVVRRPPANRWATVVAALIDGVALVAATVPPHLRPGDARRLVARARERSAVLVALGSWPVEAALRLRVEGAAWSGLHAGAGVLGDQRIAMCVEARGAPVHGHVRAPAS
jgi:hypothetical protein